MPRKIWIAGLGNPGASYVKTRHNLGFQVVRRLADLLKIRLASKKHLSLCARAQLQDVQAVLLLPQTFMNASGDCLAAWKREEGLDPRSLLVICDDMDLPLGKLRLRRFGSAGNHNGLASVIDGLKTPDFARLRMGIGKPPSLENWADFVTSPFGPQEREQAETMVEKAAGTALLWAQGIHLERLMSKVNA